MNIRLGTLDPDDLDARLNAGRAATDIGDFTTALNEFFDGKWVAPVWSPSPEIQHCIKCHGPDIPTQKARKWNQQGHMECLMCHEDHTA